MDAKFDMIGCGSLINVVRGVTTSRAHSTSVMLCVLVAIFRVYMIVRPRDLPDLEI